MARKAPGEKKAELVFQRRPVFIQDAHGNINDEYQGEPADHFQDISIAYQVGQVFIQHIRLYNQQGNGDNEDQHQAKGKQDGLFPAGHTGAFYMGGRVAVEAAQQAHHPVRGHEHGKEKAYRHQFPALGLHKIGNDLLHGIEQFFIGRQHPDRVEYRALYRIQRQVRYQRKKENKGGGIAIRKLKEMAAALSLNRISFTL